MPLQEENISINFGKGLDTKTDPFQVLPGSFLSLQNVIFNTGLEFAKRNGNQLLAKISSSGLNCATFKSELLGFDGNSLYSYSPALMTEINKGSIIGVELNATTVYRAASGQTTQDSAFNSIGLYLYVWVDSTNGAQFMVVSSSTGNQVITATSLVTTAILPRAWSLGNYLIVTYIDSATNHLRYISIRINGLIVGSPVDLATVVNSSNPLYDGVVFNNNLYLSFNASDSGGAIRTTYLDSQLNQHTTTIQSGEMASSCITMFGDPVNNQLWVAYGNGTAIKYVVLNSVAQSIISPTIADSSETNAINICGYANSGNGVLYYEISNTYSYSSTRSDYITTVTANAAGTSIGSPTVFLRSVGLISKTFTYNGNYYFWVAYNGHYQPTYFLVNENGVIIAKAAYTNGGGYTTSSCLTTVNQITTTQFQFAYLFKDILETQQGQVYTQTGVNSLTFDFNTQNLYQNTEAGNNLNITGGYLYAYDGYGPVEQNFHLFPEDLAYTSTSATTGINPNTYAYSATYEWVDNQGNTFRSAPSVPLTVTIGAPTTGISLNIPTLRLTSKQSTRSPVNIVLYRTAPSLATNIYYRVSSITSPTFNNTTIDSVQITDTSPDASIIGNELLYTTGGVVEDTGAPAAIGTTLYKNRVFLITAEDRNTLWYSKQTLEATPVELSDLFTLYIDPRFGVVTAISVMDDKLIIFKANAIFYMTGEGPDATGANNDFSEPVFITSIVGCSNPKSIVLTQNGLMFQSNKGIWLLDRGLGVSYLGSPVQAYNSATITSANVIPNTTQVRFTLNTGIALVYDYFYNIWGTFTNQNAAGAVIFQNLFTYLTPTGMLMQENPGVYTDNGEPFYMSLQTGWLSLAGLQGYQRAYKLYILSNFITPHILNVSVAYDFNSSITQNAIIQPTSLANYNYGSDPFYGSTQYYGGNATKEQYRINLVKQKCQSIQITLTEATDTTNPVYGAGLTLSAMNLVVGTKLKFPKLPATQSVT